MKLERSRSTRAPEGSAAPTAAGAPLEQGAAQPSPRRSRTKKAETSLPPRLLSVAALTRALALSPAAPGRAVTTFQDVTTFPSFAAAGLAASLPGRDLFLPASAGALAALDSVRLVSSGLSGNATFGAHYYFTNEHGLYTVASALGPRGGAAVGVSGGLLDLAARTKADLVVSVDASGTMKDFYEVVTAALLLVDDHVRAGKLPEAERAAAVRGLLLAPTDYRECGPAEREARVNRLAAYGLSRETVREVLTYAHAGVKDCWLTAPTAPEDIAHLTSLAREGRIVAVTADFAQSETAATVGKLMRTYGAEVATLNLSNLLDYVPERALVGRTLAAMQDVARADAVVVNSTFHRSSFPGPDNEVIGTFDKPGVGPLSRWADPNDLTRQYDTRYPGQNIA